DDDEDAETCKGAKQRRTRIAESLKYTGTTKDDALRHEVEGYQSQEVATYFDHLRFLREESHQQRWIDLKEQRDDKHHARAEQQSFVVNLDHAFTAQRAVVLSHHRTDRKRDGHGRHEDRLHDAATDAEAGLRVGAEILNQEIHHAE